jgi:competence protein ComEC
MHVQRVIRYAFNAVMVSVAVQIMLLPLLVVYFHRLSLSSLLLNIVVSFLLAALALVSFVALLLSHVSHTIAEPFFTFANNINWLMVHSIDPFAKLGLASVRVPEYTGRASWLYFIYYVPLVVLISKLFHWYPLPAPGHPVKSKKLLPLSCCFQLILIAVVLFHPFSAIRPDGKLRVDFLDVGQGDAALVTMPDGVTLLIDGGGRPSFRSPFSENGSESFERESRSIGEMVVSEYLWWRGLDSVDYVLATHADADHMDGLNDVVSNFSIRSALVGRIPANDAEYARFAQTLSRTKTTMEVVQAGDVLKFGDVTATVLSPTPTNDASVASQNDDSVVVLLKFGERSFLFTGDIEKQAERQLVAQLQNLRVDVVKVPHHGSRTSSTEAFVEATKPRLAVIPVGRTSMFGHPHEEVVERWTRNGAEVLTTGRSGTITVTTDGKELWVKKFVE